MSQVLATDRLDSAKQRIESQIETLHNEIADMRNFEAILQKELASLKKNEVKIRSHIIQEEEKKEANKYKINTDEQRGSES